MLKLKFVHLLALLAVLAFSGTHGVARAEEEAGLDSASQDALEKTQDMMRDPEKRKAAIKDNSDAQQADDSLRKLAGSESNTNAVYGLSSDIFANMVKESNGDSNQMQKMLESASKNPEAFMNSLSPEQKQKLEQISKQIGGNQK